MSKNSKKAFTVVEVVLVLAIAGLIFLMVFAVLPAVRRTQRNSQRRQDLTRFVTAINSYSENNGGALPIKSFRQSAGRFSVTVYSFDQKELVSKYIDSACTMWNDVSGTTISTLIDNDDNCSEAFRSPSGNLYGFKSTMGTYSRSETGVYPADEFKYNTVGMDVIVFYRGVLCGESEGLLKPTDSQRDFALMTLLEGNSVACADNKR